MACKITQRGQPKYGGQAHSALYPAPDSGLNPILNVLPNNCIPHLLQASPDKAICLATSEEGKGSLLFQAPEGGQGAVKANEWLKASLDALGGKGGGKADSAQGQVPDAGQLAEAMAAARAYADSKL